jgi:hypothetical protein
MEKLHVYPYEVRSEPHETNEPTAGTARSEQVVRL